MPLQKGQQDKVPPEKRDSTESDTTDDDLAQRLREMQRKTASAARRDDQPGERTQEGMDALEKYGLYWDAKGGCLEFGDTDESSLLRMKFEEGGMRCAQCLYYYSKTAFSRHQICKGAS